MMLVPAAVLLLTVAAASLPVTRAFAQDEDNVEQMIENAKTPSDYEAIAAYYDKKGAQAEKQLEWHQKLYKTYQQNPRLSTMQMHCHRLISLYKAEAREDKVMADQYRHMAKQAK